MAAVRLANSEFRPEVRRSSVSQSAHDRMTSGSPRTPYSRWSDLIIGWVSVRSAAATFSLGSIGVRDDAKSFSVGEPKRSAK